MAIDLWQVAAREAERRGLTVAASGRRALRPLIERAQLVVDRLDESKPHDAQRIDRARLNLERLISRVEGDMLSERSLQDILDVICPLWPFC